MCLCVLLCMCTRWLFDCAQEFDLLSMNFRLIDHEDLDLWCCSRSEQLQLDFEQISAEMETAEMFSPNTRGVSTSNCSVGHVGLRGNKSPAPSIFTLVRALLFFLSSSLF